MTSGRNASGVDQPGNISAGGAACTIRDSLQQTPLPRLEAQLLWQHVLEKPRAWLIAHDTDVLSEADMQRFLTLAQRRIDGEPMAYILQYKEFMGHDFHVTPDVLIPRPETELLVEHILSMTSLRSVRRVLDLGTGSGAIAISIALARPDLQVVATDVSAQALTVAQGNAQRLGAKVQFLPGDWYRALVGQQKFDVILSNPPYIHSQDPHLSQGDLRFEPPTALTDGADGLQALRTIISGATQWLHQGGALWLEHGWDQAASVRALLNTSGFSQVNSLKDLAGIERISGGVYL